MTLISACSLVGVAMLPLMARRLYQKLMTGLIGLAAGSLAASALFHLLPQVGWGGVGWGKVRLHLFNLGLCYLIIN